DRRPWLYLCTVACLIGFLGLATLPLAAPSTWIVLVGIGTGGLFPLATALPLDYARTPADAASWSAMMLFGGYLLSASGPLLGGVVVDATGSYATVFGIMTASSALLLAVCYGMKPPQRRAGTAA
ncbi:MAG: MFS transporter, partial [Proteobacteria bacterium]